MKLVVYLHGLNSSHTSFNYLTQNLPTHRPYLIDYESHQPLQQSIDQVSAQLPRNVSFSLVGHSLGGLISALITADHPERIEKLVAISSPLSGSRTASTLQWLPGSLAVLCDIVPHAPLINRCCELQLPLPTLSIISTQGHLSISPEPNDGVVSLISQRALKFGKKIEVSASHFEVLLHDQTVRAIKKFLFEDEKSK